ncbi:MAG: cytochrome c oxidase assembly protein [Actinobacteria bacterium]|nr:cytochrome c oxidase assembly protein [Actinomycetota bacterium]
MTKTGHRLLAATGMALVLVLAAVTGGTGFGTGHDLGASGSLSSWLSRWSLPPIEVALITVLGFAYATRVVRAPGQSRRHVLFGASGFAVLLLAVSSPLGALAQGGLLSAHMLQHTMIGAVAPLLLLLGVAPRALHPVADTPFGRVARRLSHPAVAFPAWLTSTLVWLLPSVHEAVLGNQPLWILQQASFLLFGLMLWAPILSRLPGHDWFGTAGKVAYMIGVWFVGLATANILWFSGTVIYGGHTGAVRVFGLNPLRDQSYAGTIMVVVHCSLAFGAIAVLFFRHASESETRQRLVERGVDPGRVERAVRDGLLNRLADEQAVLSGHIGPDGQTPHVVPDVPHEPRISRFSALDRGTRRE